MRTTTSTRTSRSFPRSNIVAVTGLSRPALAAMFSHDGLFGRDSALSAAEQAVVQSRLPRIPLLRAPSAPAILGTRLKLLADYVDALVAGREGAAERERLVGAGYREAAIAEAEITVDNVRTVFGTAPPATAAVSEVRRYAHAA